MADKAASAKAREEGNALFRKGRWADAAAAYERAGEADPTDAVPWANRAQALLKLERWQEAESSATAALARDPTSVKAQYRRALARRALGRHADAAADLKEVLGRDPNNTAAAAELSEVEMEVETALARERSTARAAARDKATAVPAEVAAPTIVQPVDASTPTAAVPSPAAAQPAAPAPTGFAALRKSRDARPAYAGTAGARTSPPASSAPSPAVAPSAPASTAAPAPPVAAPTPAAPAPPAPAPAAPLRQPPPPPDPTSTSPGAGLALLRALKGTPQQYRRWYLRHYATATIARIVAPVLEPDALGLLLASVAEGGEGGVGEGGGEEEEKAWTREVIERLKALPRWRMTVGMLSKAERAAGEGAWAWAGGQGGLL